MTQSALDLSALDEMLNNTVELLADKFGFHQTSIFMTDKSGEFVEFRTGVGPATQQLTEQRRRFEVGPESIIGWVVANNQPRIITDVSHDPVYLRHKILPETLSEACVPISKNDRVLGALDVQSMESAAFTRETVIALEVLASQIAATISTLEQAEQSQSDTQELERLYRSSRLIAAANNEEDILKAAGRILGEAPFTAILFRIEENLLRVVPSSNEATGAEAIEGLQSKLIIDSEEINEYLVRGPAIETSISENIPNVLKNIMRMAGLNSAAFLPIRNHDELAAIIMLGMRRQDILNVPIQPHIHFADLISISIEKVETMSQKDKQLGELESLASINDLIATSADLDLFFRALLEMVQKFIGNYNLAVAIYDQTTNTINIPFSYENGEASSIESFPLGEGLTSILIRTRQPLMLVEDTVRRAAELGAKVAGQPSRSWMGSPMLVQNEPIGALILQDLDNDHAFDKDDLKFFTTLAGQVAGVIHNARLLDESKRKALQLETAAEIARDISGSLNLDELLIKAVTLIRDRFDFYHSAIFLLDLPGEFALIREATGNAGVQMKRSGYKIGIGSKSIIGFVSGRGEPLVVNDTSRDATYYANPLLPDTRAEAAFPLKVGDRILGVLDVQSKKPFVFYEDNLRIIQILADQLAVAVANTELFAETQEHLSQHRLLHHITTSAASGSTLEEALESAVSGLQVTLGGDRVAILLADREKKMLEVKASVGYAEEIASMRIEFGRGVTGWVAAHKRPLRLRDVSEDPRYIEASANTRSELAVPLLYRNEVLGVLNVESEQVDAYSDNDEEMLGTLGGSLAAIIANARLVEQIRLQAERERTIYEVTSKIRRSTDIQSILMTTASEISKITGAHYAKIRVKPVDDNGKDGQ
jgi:GAF domain-containing protein